MDKTTKLSRALIFVNNRVNGFYRYQNKFQIFPIDNSLQGVANLHIPLFIEFYYDPRDVTYDEGKPEQICISDYENKIVRECLLLLTVFTQYNFYRYENDQCWFYPLPSNSDPHDDKKNKGYSENIKSVWGQKIFMGELNNEYITVNDNDFSDINLEEIKKEDANSYFNVYGQRLSTDSVSLPIDIDLYFDEYYKNIEEKKSVFLAAASLFKSGLTLRDTRAHLSLSFASLISSIETLSAYDYKDVKIERCPECGLERFQVTRKFKEFFRFYINNERDLIKYINKMYSLRSKILHEGRLFLSDITEDDFSDVLEIEHLVRLIRISIVNWLIKSKERIL